MKPGSAKRSLTETKKNLSKLKRQNQRFHILVPDYLMEMNPSRLQRAKKFRQAYLDKLAKNPFFSDLLKKAKQNIKLSVFLDGKKFEYELLRTGIRNPGTGDITLILFDAKGRGMLLGGANFGGELIWYPLNYAIIFEPEGPILKKSIKHLLPDEHKAFFSVSDQINRKARKINFVDIQDPGQYARKVRAAKQYL
jgi:hypothetical protein